jgi:hypothetical protein
VRGEVKEMMSEEDIKKNEMKGRERREIRRRRNSSNNGRRG